MTARRWRQFRTDGALTLARAAPPRFDIAAETVLPAPASASLGRVAHQVRQDMWRALRRLRGFSPVVEVRRTEAGLAIRAGGRAAAPRPGDAARRIEAVLEDPANRRRWIAHAGKAARRHGAAQEAARP